MILLKWRLEGEADRSALLVMGNDDMGMSTCGTTASGRVGWFREAAGGGAVGTTVAIVRGAGREAA